MYQITQKIIIMATAFLLSLSGKAQVAVVSSNGNKNCDVGEIPIEYSLTPSGAVSYTSLSMCTLIQKGSNPVCPLCTIVNSTKPH
mgnify:CR=1 FL=1